MKKEVSSTQKMLNTWAIAVIIWSVYRSYFKTDLPIWFDEFIAKPLVFLVPVWYYIIKYEKGTFWHGVDLKWKSRDVLLGIAGGCFLLVISMLVYFQKTGMFLPAYSSMVFFYIAVALASSFSEEILSRGFVLKRLYEDSKNVYSSVFFASFLFFMIHIPILFTNPNIRGGILIQVMITDFLLSFGVSLAYLQKKNVLIAIIIHAIYNLSIYLLI